MIAPNPKLKSGRRKKLDFDKLDWSRYIAEDKLIEAIPEVYGCDPRDETAYRALEKGIADGASERALEKEAAAKDVSEGKLAGKLANCTVG
jgi:hypothetical protein